MMTKTADTPTIDSVSSTLDNVQSQADVKHAFHDIHQLLSQKPAKQQQETLNSLSGHLKGLGLDGFHIAGFDAKEFKKNGGGLIVTDDKNNRHLIDAQGNEFALTDKSKAGNLERKSELPTGQWHFGSHGRTLDVSPDGKKGQLEIGRKDNLWQISADILGKNNKKLNPQDISDIEQQISKLAKENKIKNPNRIYTGKFLEVDIPKDDQEKAVAEATARPAGQPAREEMAPAASPPVETAEAKAAREAKEAELQAAKLAASAFYPDQDMTKLKPDFNAQPPQFNVLAPKGLIEGTPNQPITDKVDGVRTRTVGDWSAQDDKGERSRDMSGSFADRNWVFGHDSTFNAHEVIDANGGLVSRTVKFPGDSDTTAYYKNGDKQSILLNKPQTITTTRLPDGNYTTNILLASGRTYNFLSKGDGSVLDYHEVQP